MEPRLFGAAQFVKVALHSKHISDMAFVMHRTDTMKSVIAAVLLGLPVVLNLAISSHFHIFSMAQL